MTIQIGMGSAQPKWVLHIANRPQLPRYQDDIFQTLVSGDVPAIIKQTSNHWRKAFSLMAKISFALFPTGCDSWQQYRDTKLLTEQGYEAINFEPWQPDETAGTRLSLICGFQYAAQQVPLERLLPLEAQPKILVAESRDLIVTPYFDWRQLTNETLSHLVPIMKTIIQLDLD